MRRLFAALVAFLALTGTLLVLPVYAAPAPTPHPVKSSADEIALGSVIDPADAAVVAIDGQAQPDGVTEAEATASAAAKPSAPASDAPAETTPAEATPAGETPADEATPPSDAPADEAPSESSPSESSPSEAPVTEAPATQAPASDAPTAEAPSAATPGDEDVVVSGDELPGVPALTVSQPDTAPFETVGVTWQQTPDVLDVVVQLRVKHENGQWGEWTTLEPDDVEQTPSAVTGDHEVRAGTAPYWTGRASGVEAIVQGADGAVPEDVRITMIDPGKSAADALPTAAPASQAHAATAMPPVITRAGWGADESIMTWDPEYAPTIKAATVHHTADSNDYSAKDVPAIMRSIQRYHSVTRGWGDIGYNVIVDKFGRIFEGRAGGLSSTVIGAHAGGFNTYTFGVSMLGNYDTAQVPQATVDAVAAIIAWKFSLYGVDPNGSTTLVSAGGGTAKYKAGTPVNLPTIFGHRDVGSTACPGQYGYAKLPAIRAAVVGASGAPAYVRALYQDMMGRGADETGMASWTSALARGTDRRAVSRGFSNSTEYRMLSITQAYRQVFNRDPDPSGVNTWMNVIAAGVLRIDDLRPKLMASEEFYNRGGSSDAAFVDNLYRASLGRGAGPSEIAFWGDLRRRTGPTPVINAIWGSSEAGMRRVDQSYQYYLGRAAGLSEQQFWLPVVMGSGTEQLREEIVISYEYFVRSGNRFP